MRLSRFTRIPAAVLLLVGVTLTLAPQALHPTTASANIITTTAICGPVEAYVAATPTSIGVIELGGISYTIAQGVSLGNSFLITSGANICVNATFDSLGEIISGVVVNNAAFTFTVCGIVSLFLPPTLISPGEITIGGTTYSIAPGAVLTSSALLTPHATPFVCFQGFLNPLGQIAGGSFSSGPNTGVVRICGFVSSYTPATFGTIGLVTINGHTFAIAPGAVFVGGQAIQPGNDICIISGIAPNLQLLGGSVTGDTNLALVICGAVANYIPASTAPGLLTINGTTYTIAAGTILANDTLTFSGGTICFNGTTNGAGQIIGGTFSSGSVTPPTFSICGVVTGFVAPTSSLAGSIGIGGTPYAIAAGVTLSGASLITNGVNICLNGTVNTAGQIASATITFNGGVQVSVCGLISGYTPSGTATAGLLTIAGITFPVAPGASIAGSVATGTTLGLTLVLNGQGAISSGTVASTFCSTTAISGPITAYVPPTATAAGSITIAGITYPVAPGTTLTVGNGVPLSATLYRPASGLLHSGRPIAQ